MTLDYLSCDVRNKYLELNLYVGVNIMTVKVTVLGGTVHDTGQDGTRPLAMEDFRYFR